MTLTLPGVAGIILSIGMAVDANVIIFTRIKEEIGLGTSVKNAIKAVSPKALSAIIDGNVTTLIAAAVLFWRGSGTVKGFAATLAIGIVLSMFTALFVTKFALNCFYEMGFEDAKFYGCRKDMKTRPFLKFRKLYFALSLVIIRQASAAWFTISLRWVCRSTTAWSSEAVLLQTLPLTRICLWKIFPPRWFRW